MATVKERTVFVRILFPLLLSVCVSPKLSLSPFYGQSIQLDFLTQREADLLIKPSTMAIAVVADDCIDVYADPEPLGNYSHLALSVHFFFIRSTN